MAENTIVSSGPQLAPRASSAGTQRHDSTASYWYFFKAVGVPKPTQFPSGEKKGVLPYSTLASSSPSKRSRGRKHKRRLAYFPATYASRRPSGESAK